MDRGAEDWADLPLIDRHETTIAAPRSVVWSALEGHVRTALMVSGSGLFSRALDLDPREGFTCLERVECEQLTLVGRHRFSRYRLQFDLAELGPDLTRLGADSSAVFPGVGGRVYRTLVISSRGHRVAMGRMLRAIDRQARAA